MPIRSSRTAQMASAGANWRLASSVIIVSRNTGRILMMRRGATASFMPNALVFPGGVAMPSDEQQGPPTKVAALREVFEETGLLMTSKGIESACTSDYLADFQDSVKKDAALFKNVSKSLGTDQLIEWNTWLTPTTHSKRFMTSFFLLPVDGEPSVRMCEDEMSGFGWEAASICLEKAFAGHVSLPPPQVYELTRLSQTPSAELASAGNTSRVICPQPIQWADGSRISNIFPGDHLYIEEDSMNQPGRKMSLEELQVDKNKPTHRAEYLRRPQWAECHLYRHSLQEPYDTDFKKFRSHSSLL